MSLPIIRQYYIMAVAAMKNIKSSRPGVLLSKIKSVFVILLFVFLICNLLATTVNAASLPSLKVEPESVDFGAFTVGSSSPVQTVTITNKVDSTNVLTIYDIYLDGPDADSFIIKNDNCSGRILDGSISSTLELVFKPASAGSKNATLMIPSNATVKPYELALSGKGIAPNNGQTSKPTENGFSVNWPLIAILVVVAVIVGLILTRRLTSK